MSLLTDEEYIPQGSKNLLLGEKFIPEASTQRWRHLCRPTILNSVMILCKCKKI